MTLSNRATPIYYGEFREKVVSGEIPVCKEISMEMNRIDDLIANPGIYYDDQAVIGFVEFCESELTLTDGSDLVLLDTFKLWAEQVFGWYYFVERSIYEPNADGHGGHYVRRMVKKRLINKQYLIVARGAAKSMYGACIQNYFLNVNPSTTQQITTAPTMKQAEEVMSPIRTAIVRARGPYFKFLTEGSLQNTTGIRANRVKLASTKKGIENFLTGSILEVRPMAIDKLQGLRPMVSTVDEWLSGDIREDVVGAIEQGASKLEDYLIVLMSSQLTVRNSSGDTIKMELLDILKGVYINPHVSIWYYRLDDVEEVSDPATWLKANPNLGKTVSYETYQLDVERAENAHATRKDILVKTRCYISSLTLLKLPGAMRIKYEQFLAEGSLQVLECTVLDMMEVYDDLEKFIEDSKYDVRCLGFDPYNAKEFITRWEQENGPYGIEKVIQGAKSESVPLGELKTLSEERMLIFDEELMSFTMGNAITLEDTNGNRKLFKKRYDQKVDSVAALMDAYVAYKANKDAFD